MKRFNKEDDDKYPTFSFCFKGARFHWMNDHYIFESFGLNATQYERMLRGEIAERYDRNDLYRSYAKTSVSFNYSKAIDFKGFNVDMRYFLRSLHFATEKKDSETKIANWEEWEKTKEHAMHLIHQTTNKICFSRKSTDLSGSTRLYDLLTIDSSRIWFYNETEMEVFVHYPNQLIRSLDKAKYSDTFSHLQSILSGTTPKVLEFKLTESKRIKKRHDSNEKCNPNIKNYDQYLQQKMAEKLVEEIECVPIYLKVLLSNESGFDVCQSPTKLKKAYQLLQDLKTNIKKYEKPCDEILVLSIDSINNNPIPIPDDIAIKFIYTEKMYEEIQHIKALGFENWLSNVGGFVGIFLGYSMMQFPEFLLLFADVFNRKWRKSFASMYNLFRSTYIKDCVFRAVTSGIHFLFSQLQK